MRIGTSPRQQGFTLIELLVVVSIIALLIAVLVPSLGRAKASANRVKCAAVLKQWGSVVNIYMSEYDGWLLSDTKWAVALNGNGPYDTEWPANSKFSRGLHTCPGDPAFGLYLKNGSQAATANMGPIDYAFVRFMDANGNFTAAGKMNGNSYRSTDITHHSSALLMADCGTGAPANGKGISGYLQDFDGPGTATLQSALLQRHLGLGNVMFLDAHVEQHDYADYKKNIYDGNPPIGKRIWTVLAP